MLLISHIEREWYISTILHNIIRERNDKIGVFTCLILDSNLLSLNKENNPNS